MHGRDLESLLQGGSQNWTSTSGLNFLFPVLWYRDRATVFPCQLGSSLKFKA